MPKARDITNDLVHLRGQTTLGGQDWKSLKGRTERSLAFNAWSTFSWTLVGGFMVLQAGFLIWLL